MKKVAFAADTFKKNYKEKELVKIAEFHKKKSSNAQIDFDN